ncbi:AzlC family ABC transporter permease [Bacillus sp. OK048]|uniref:AzlC family ABC transporter permease n=1 Tax=Bacillus sp. OK048 TaxID=1882761 RepID=UPI000882219B|nr:AzlC family ABC transporter permease [Bacillus sp. OK048]SDN22928.1 4-azaleucine resistance probable transporter AzlC [Bacillus sp. OK048]
MNISENTYLREENSFLAGVRDCLPTVLGYLSIGFAAGVVEKTAGLSIVEVGLISLLLYAGSGQFIAAAMIGANSPTLAIIFTIFFINLRHLLMSAAISPYFRHLSPYKNVFIGSLLTDETFGVAMNEAANRKELSEKWMYGLNITAYLNWFIANIAGAFFGEWISNPEKFGLDFALAGMFIGLLVLQMVNRRNLMKDILVALSAVAIVVGVSLVASGSVGIIVATIIAATIGMAVEIWK